MKCQEVVCKSSSNLSCPGGSGGKGQICENAGGLSKLEFCCLDLEIFPYRIGGAGV